MKAIPAKPPSLWPTRIRVIHKWLSLIVGLQIVIWMASGLYMASVDIDIIHGDHLTKANTQRIDYNAVNPLPASFSTFQQVTLTTQLSRPVYLIDDGVQSLVIDAQHGTPIVVDEQYIIAQASDIYRDNSALLGAVLLNRYPDELGGRSQPIWQVHFDDLFSPTLYLSPTTAQLIKSRSDLWRFFDLMWILHIMDYQDGEDVNNSLLTFSVMLAVLACCSGAWLVFYSFTPVKRKQGFSATLRQVHKWLALVVAIQLIIWGISGGVFNLIDAQDIHLKRHITPQNKQPLSSQQIDFERITKQFPNSNEITVGATPIGAVVSFSPQSNYSRVNLASLTTQQIPAQLASQIAQAHYANSAAMAAPIIINPGDVESRKLNRQLWRIDYQDKDNSSLYIDALTGDVLDIKNDHWRLKDWFWMLHIMDYSDRANFNHPLLITFASIATFAALSGFLLLFNAFSRRDFGLTSKHSRYKITLQSAQQPIESHIVTGEQSLLHALKEQGVELPSGCGGKGTCCQCMLSNTNGESPLSSQEKLSLSSDELAQGCRLSCQLQVTSDLTVTLASSMSQQMTTRVISSEFKTPLIKEIVLARPTGGFSFHAGQFINLHIPAFDLTLNERFISSDHRSIWQQHQLANRQVTSTQPVTRSYSIASAENQEHIILCVKLTPPVNGHQPGLASSYLCTLAVDDTVTFNQPIGDFTTDSTSTRELVLIGAGSGMAPLKSHVDTLLAQGSSREVSLWFGARTQQDILYQAHFEKLATQHPNFSWHVSLSQPTLSPPWRGNTGHIQRVLFAQYLRDHPSINTIDFLLCGPAPMMQAVRTQLRSIGVSDAAIKQDTFT